MNDYDEICWILARVRNYTRDAVYCKGSTTVLNPSKSRERERVCVCVCVYGKQIDVTEQEELGIEIRVCT